MPSTDDRDIYKQRYEIFRHLDRLRWQMLQISVGAGSIVLALGVGSSNTILWWPVAIVGVLLTVLGTVMERITYGIFMNSKVLRKFGERIGDVDIPDQANWCNVPR